MTLQGMHKDFPGTLITEVKAGDVMICNYGYKQTVVSLEMSKSGKSVCAVIDCDGKLYNRKYRITSRVVIERNQNK